MEFPKNGSNIKKSPELTFYQWQPEYAVKMHQQNISLVSETICTDRNFRFRQAGVRIFNYLVGCADMECKVAICARQLSKKLGVSYDTVTKTLKYLKQLKVLHPDK